MSKILDNLKYTKTHEWVNVNGNQATVGITDHAQELLGDLVFVELPRMGQFVNKGDACAVVESVKAASDIYAPVSGKVVAINDALSATPELINQSAYEDGWIFKIEVASASEASALLNAKAYNDLLASEAH